MQNEFVIEQRKLGEEKRATASSYATAEQNQAAKHREKCLNRDQQSLH